MIDMTPELSRQVGTRRFIRGWWERASSLACLPLLDLHVPSSPPQLELVIAGPPRAALTIDRALIASLQPALLRVATRMLGDRAQAEDVVQETWISALSFAHTYEARATVLTWLIAIMRRRIVDMRRKSQHRMLELEDSCWISEATWAEQLHARDHLESLEGAFQDLSELERSAIVLCDVHDLDRDTAARELQVTRGHLRVLLHRGHGHVRQAARAHVLHRDR